MATTDSPFSFTSLAPPSPQAAQQAQKLELVLQDKVAQGGSATRDLFAGHAAHVRNDPIEVSRTRLDATLNIDISLSLRASLPFGVAHEQFSKQLSLWASGTGWRSYTDYIGGRIMYDGYSAKQIKAITESPQGRQPPEPSRRALSRFADSVPPLTVTAKIRQLSEDRLETLHLPPEVDRQKKLASLEQQLREVVLEVADGLVAKMDSVRFLRFFGASVNILLARMHDQGIHISLPEYAAFREVAVEAAKRKQTMLILPCHKSHIDYLTMSCEFKRVSTAARRCSDE